MTEFGDLDFERPPELPEAAQSSRIGWWILLAVLLVGAGVAAYFFLWLPRQAPPVPSPPPAPATETPAPPPQVRITLPPLDVSDGLVRGLVRGLSSHPELAAWLAPANLIRTFVFVVEQVASGSNPVEQLGFLAPKQRFRAAGSGASLTIDPRSYQRYDTAAAVVASLDAAGCAQVYRTLEPMIEEAYRELDHPEGGFRDVLARALRQILLTPVIDDPVALKPKVITYQFGDPALESLAPVQKQLLGLGPRNLRLVQAKAREIAAALDITP